MRWPQDPTSKETTILCCYMDNGSFDSLHEYFEAGLNMWLHPLGLPSVKSGHSLVMMHVSGHEQTAEPYCYSPREPDEENSDDEEWNPSVPDDTLAIGQVFDGGISTSTNEGYSDK